jgi:hypothetical protein
MDSTDFLQDSVVRILTETYAICRADRGHPNAFATVRDGTETTVVIDETDVDSLDASDVVSGWKRLTFEIELPFELVGFLATVATALADADVSVFVLSSYSTDHLFVRQSDLDTAVTQLKKLGCVVDGDDWHVEG